MLANWTASNLLLAIMTLLMMEACAVKPLSLDAADHANPCIRLADIHGLWGGIDIAILADGTAYLREVKVRQERKERRFKKTLPPSDLAGMKQFIANAGYFSFREKTRAGVPDEARPRITACFDGRCLSSAKWASDKDSRFDLVYQRLLELAEGIAKERPIWVGKYDASVAWPSFLKTT